MSEGETKQLTEEEDRKRALVQVLIDNLNYNVLQEAKRRGQALTLEQEAIL